MNVTGAHIYVHVPVCGFFFSFRKRKLTTSWVSNKRVQIDFYKK